MLRYICGRVLQGAFVLWAAFTLSFFVLYALPSDPAKVVAGPNTNLTPEQLEAVRRQFGFDRPLLVQYAAKLGDVLQGDLGRSMQSRQSVGSLLGGQLPATLQLAAVSLAASVLVGGAIAVLATYVRGRRLKGLLLTLPPVGVALPPFWVGLLLLQLFAFHWPLLPPIGNKGWESLVLPAVTMAVPTGALLAQLLARSLETTLREGYVATAHAKGASRARIHFRHALRNAALPTVTMLGLLVGNLLAGAVIVETVFSRQGLGRVTVDAVTNQDLPVVQGLVILGALIFVLVNLAVDLVYPVLDPRVGQVGRPARPKIAARVEVAAR
ncbi:ABC transporter permease [Actinomadura rugatobispora]|uniref:ABC transporter permease n=1 Tax=Actinomadura rugatobispora TaxID=1994 RepID=A0ABW0ZX05_9ACTN|nr:ABC transporter permease [Actinomadura rugatobispora]